MRDIIILATFIRYFWKQYNSAMCLQNSFKDDYLAYSLRLE